MDRSANAPPGDERGTRHGEAWVARAGEVTLRRLVADVAVGVESRPGSPPPLGTTLAMAACAEERELAHVELRF